MNRVALDFGFIQIYWYSLCIVLGMICGMYLVYRETKKKHISEGLMTNLIFYTVVSAIIGARLYYVAFRWDYYSNNLMEILEIWNGGLAIHGAIILGGLYLIFHTKKYKLDTLQILDICCVGLIIGQVCGRWGNFFNQEAYGAEVSLDFLKGLHLPGFIIDGMHIDGAYYHPTFLYESLWCIIGFVILIFYRKRRYVKTGQIFGIYCMWYGFGRFFIEGLRTDSLMLGSFKVAQIVSIGMFLTGLFFFIRRLKTGRFDYLYNEVSPTLIQKNYQQVGQSSAIPQHQTPQAQPLQSQIPQQPIIEQSTQPIQNNQQI
jgi:phosphatidylglycerol:prolipoprotein diacylglycerol transferase